MSLVRAVTATLGSPLRRAALLAVLLAALILGAPGVGGAAEHLFPAAATASQDNGSCGRGCVDHVTTATGTVPAGAHAPELAAPPLVAHARRTPPAPVTTAGHRSTPCELRAGPVDLCVWRT
ncbi:hypothetical protein [Longispora urticae]